MKTTPSTRSTATFFFFRTRFLSFLAILLALALALILVGMDELRLVSAAADHENDGTRASGFNDDYTTYHEMVSYLEELENGYPDIVEVHVLATTEEGRFVYVVKLSDSDNLTYQGAKEPELLFIGGHHGNELISVEMILHLTDHLVTSYESDYDIRTMVENTELWLVPMLNPDGHVYVEEVDDDWRKNRRDNGDGSFGVDLNRNYAYMWGTDAHTSDDPGSNLYHGPEPFSEPETRGIRNLTEQQNFSFSLSFHSKGQELYYPWGYDHDAVAEDHELLARMADKLCVFNGYEPMKASDSYTVRGDSEDYLYSMGVLPFTVELARQYAPDDFLPELEKNLPMCLYLIHSGYKISRLQLEYSSDGQVLRARSQGDERAILSREATRDYFNASHQWNWLIYMSGDSSLSSEVDDDLSLITANPLPDYLNIIVLADQKGDSDTKAYIIDSSGKEEIPLSLINPAWSKELRLDEVDVLADFLNWSHNSYPSENTFLELWGHGKAWIYAVYEGSDSRSMNARELGTALQEGLGLHENTGKTGNRSLPLDILGFDECAMANIEAMMESPYLSDYYIGSEKDEPFNGWPYDEIIKKLNVGSLLLPWNLSSTISHTIIDFYNEHPSEAGNIPVLFSVTRTLRAPEFKDAAGSLFQKLRNRLSNESFLTMLRDQRDRTEEYDRPDFLDFYDFLLKVNAETDDFEINYYIEELLDLEAELVVLNLKTNDDVGKDPPKNAHGFTIFFPESESLLKSPYPSLSFNRETSWYLFLHEFINGQELECYLENTEFFFEDIEKEDLLATKVLVNFTLDSEVEREDLTLLINGTTKHYEEIGDGRVLGQETTETIFLLNLSVDAGKHNFSLSFYENFSGTLKLELVVYSSLFKNDEFNWDEAEEVSSAMTIFFRQADLYFQEVSLAEAGDGASMPGVVYLNTVHSSGGDANASSVLHVPSVAVKKQLPYQIRVFLSSVYFSSYCLLTVELDDEVVYQDNYFLRENSSELVEMTLPFVNASQELRFTLDRPGRVNETNETNNALNFHVSAFGLSESVTLSHRHHDILLNDFIPENASANHAGDPFPLAASGFNNSSPIHWNVYYFYGVRLVSAKTGESYDGVVSKTLLDVMIEGFQENELLSSDEFPLPASSGMDFTLEFRNFQTIVDFLEEHEDAVVLLELVFYSQKNLTDYIAGKYEDGKLEELSDVLTISVRFSYEGENGEGPGPGEETRDEGEQMDALTYGALGLLAVVVVVLVVMTKRRPEEPVQRTRRKTVEVRPRTPQEDAAPQITPAIPPVIAPATPPGSAGGAGMEDDAVVEVED